MLIKCPKCHQSMQIDGGLLTKELLCSSCGTAFVESNGETKTFIRSGGDETVTYGANNGSGESQAAALIGNKRFGDYELLEEIARGGMGIVYKARQISLNRIVAVKMIKSGELAGDDEVQRFRSEAEAAAQLDHPNIVGIYEVGEQEGQHFFSMGFVDGAGLDEQLKDRPLPPREAAELIATIAEAVQYAHEQGIIHRDLKPANVLIDISGKPRVTDFGLAKRIAGDSDMTATGQVMGTPSYMPPEQAGGRIGQIGPRADVYALGAVLYSLLTGRPPFQSANVVETLKQVLEVDPIRPRLLNRTIPRDLETICLKCLEKSTNDRYATAAELAEDLRRFLEGRPIRARPLGIPGRIIRWSRRHPVAATAIVVFLIAIPAGVVSYRNWQEHQQQLIDAKLAKQREEEGERRQQLLSKVLDGDRVLDDLTELEKSVVLEELGRLFSRIGSVSTKRTEADRQVMERLTRILAPRPKTRSKADLDNLAAAAAKKTVRNDLAQLAIAFHNYHDTFGSLPAHAIYSKSGQPLLSWRVAILPFIQQAELYKRFRLNEPWDSEHNKQLISEMPRVYRHKPFAYSPTPTKSIETPYQVFVGSAKNVGSVFVGKRGLRFRDVADGYRRTVLLTMSRQHVPWTKPADLQFDAGSPLPLLGEPTGEDGKAWIGIAMVDGTSGALLPETTDETLRALITRNGGEQIPQLTRVRGTAWLGRKIVEKGDIFFHPMKGKAIAAKISGSGRFEFEWLIPAGRYRVSFSVKGAAEKYRSPKSSGQVIDVRGDQKDQISFVLRP